MWHSTKRDFIKDGLFVSGIIIAKEKFFGGFSDVNNPICCLLLWLFRFVFTCLKSTSG